MSRRFLLFLMALLTCVVILAGCGSDGSDGAKGDKGDPGLPGTDATTAKVSQIESCGACHNDIAATHEIKNANPWSAKITKVNATATGVTVTFHVDATTKLNGSDVTNNYNDGFADITAANLYVVQKKAATGWANYGGFEKFADVTSAVQALTSDGAGNYTVAYNDTTLGALVLGSTDPFRFIIELKGKLDVDLNGDGTLNNTADADHVTDASTKFFDAVGDVQGLTTGVDATPSETIAGDTAEHKACYRCHDKTSVTTFNVKSHADRNDSRVCVVCHNVTDLTFGNAVGFAPLRNLVHGYHNSDKMLDADGKTVLGYEGEEFGYPQRMSNCKTCHTADDATVAATRLSAVTDNSLFVPSTCKSCHGGADKTFTFNNKNFVFPSSTVAALHSDSMGTSVSATVCTTCHDGSTAPTFATIHSGEDLPKRLETQSGIQYQISKITYDPATKSLVLKWKAYNGSGSIDVTQDATATADSIYRGLGTAKPSFKNKVSAASFTGTTAAPAKYSGAAEGVEGIRVLLGYYGWSTKDIANYDNYDYAGLLKKTVSGTTTTYGGYSSTEYAAASAVAPSLTTVSTAAVAGTAPTMYNSTDGYAYTKIQLNSDELNYYQSKKIAVAIIGNPSYKDTYGNFYPVKADSIMQDFTLPTTAADVTGTTSEPAIDKTGCDKCHDNIFMHSGNHPVVGNVSACKMCHNNANASSHYANQSRSIGGYVHAIHVEEPNTSGDAIKYPNNIQNCSLCHGTNSYEVPSDNDHSAVVNGGFNSATSLNKTTNAIVGPAAQACMSCHTGYLFSLNNDNYESGDTAAIAAEDTIIAGRVATWNAHAKTFGFRVLTSDIDGGDPAGSGKTDYAALSSVMALVQDLLNL